MLSFHSQLAIGLGQPTPTPCTATGVRLAPTFVPDGGSQPSSATVTPIVVSVPCPTSTRTLIASPGTRLPLVMPVTATLTPSPTPITVGDCAIAPVGNGQGLSGKYFYDPSPATNFDRLSVLVTSRVDQTISFDWNTTPPPAPLPNKYNFSVRWTGQIQAEYSGDYTFNTVSDDGVFLWINGKQILSDWSEHPANTSKPSKSIPLEAGKKYDIEFDYFANGQNFSSVSLTWTQPCGGGSTIPTTRLYPTKSLDTIGVFRGFAPYFSFYLKNANTSGNADYQAAFGASNDLPITGDWDGDGRDSMGVFRIINGQAWYFLSNDNIQTAFADYSVVFSPTGITPAASAIPIAGRWRLGQPHDGIGLFRPSTGTFYLKDELTSGTADRIVVLTQATSTDIGIKGDWDGDGRDKAGFLRHSTQTFYFGSIWQGATSTTSTAQFSITNTTGPSTTDLPFTGDWLGQGRHGIGVYSSGAEYPGLAELRNSLTTGPADTLLSFGVAGDRPLTGHWPTVEEQLLTYGVELVDLNPAQKWDASEKLAILTGIRDTAIAFRKVTNPPDPLNVVFQRVMGMANQGHIIFRRDINQTGLSSICATNQLSVPRTVTCYGALTNGTGLVNKFTVVHELGHIFDYQSGSPNTGSPTPTPVAGATALHDRMNNGQPIVLDCPSIGPSGTVTPSALVMGVNAVVNPTATWTRGERGWGSGPAKNTSGGPLITNYQQDPLFIQGAVTVDLAVSEAAADTFLNWVYRNITVGSSANSCTDAVPGTPSGFVNSSWKAQTSNTATTGTPDPSRPGSKRYEWMNTQIPNIFS